MFIVISFTTLFNIPSQTLIGMIAGHRQYSHNFVPNMGWKLNSLNYFIKYFPITELGTHSVVIYMCLGIHSPGLPEQMRCDVTLGMPWSLLGFQPFVWTKFLRTLLLFLVLRYSVTIEIQVFTFPTLPYFDIFLLLKAKRILLVSPVPKIREAFWPTFSDTTSISSIKHQNVVWFNIYAVKL